MVSSQKYLDYVLEQLNGLEEITYPYTGAKEMLLVKEVDDSSFIKGLFKVMVDELSMTKKKK